MITIGLAVVLVAVALVVFIGMTQASDPQQVLNGVHFMGPVSYTHLDVYKRQCYWLCLWQQWSKS